LAVGSFLVLALLICARRIDALLNPQFWAEDGAFFYFEAYKIGGWKLLLTPAAGYLLLLPRLVAALSTYIPLFCVPGLFNSIALFVQTIPLAYILSSRFNSITSKWILQLLLASVYVFIPCSELQANITNSQWHLAPSVCLLLVSHPPLSRILKAFDYLIILVSSLTGPFTILLVPAIYLLAYTKRHRHFYTIAAFATGGALIQIAIYIFGKNTRPVQTMHLTLRTAVMIIAKIFLRPLMGETGYSYLTTKGGILVYIVGLVLYLPIIIYIYAKMPRPLLIFPYLSVILIVLIPITALPGLNLYAYGDANRYFYMPMSTFLFGLSFSFLMRGRLIIKGLALLSLLTLLMVGVPFDFFYQPFENYHFRQQARLFSNLWPGTGTTFESNPPGWNFTLIKHGPINNIDLLVSGGPTALCSLESVGGFGILDETLPKAVSSSEGIVITGWAVDEKVRREAAGVFICVDDQTNIPALYGLIREDIAYKYQNAHYRFSGFKADLPAAVIPRGRHTVSLKIISADKSNYLSSGKIVFEAY
jgi:hypothetical protein